MGFKILDENNEAMFIKDIDKEVAEFWKVEIHKKYYAYPKSEDEKINHRFMMRNWFDTICYLIHSQKLENWDLVLIAFLEPYINMKDDEWNKLSYIEKLNEIFSWPEQKPYIDLILYWKSKKYVPKYVQD